MTYSLVYRYKGYDELKIQEFETMDLLYSFIKKEDIEVEQIIDN